MIYRRKKKNPILNKLWLPSLLFFLFFIYFIPQDILYPKYKICIWILFTTIIILLPFLVFKTLKSLKYKIKTMKTFSICVLSIIIVIPSFGLFQKVRKEKDLKEKGRTINSCVIDKKESGKHYYVKCSYVVDNTEYITFHHTDTKNSYHLGDSIKLVYNIENPNMYELVFETPKRQLTLQDKK